MFIAPLIIQADSSAGQAASGVLSRTIGPAASQFHFQPIQNEKGFDTFTYQANNGRVDIAGSSSVAMCRGAYEYLKKYCHCQVSWSGENVALPKQLPDADKTTVTTSNIYRHYFNVCTFGYTTVWWDWNRWQREIDWMALHGINMPLAMNGQEKIWQETFKGLGLSQDSLDGFFTGPAFLPWHRMGNLDHHMGPLSQNWIDGQAELQKKILGREHQLGMTPVVPGFSGFVPVNFGKKFPNVHLDSPSAWAGFAPTKFISPLDPMFVKIGTDFLKRYQAEFGSNHLYLCDTFNEMSPQFPVKDELADLKATGDAVYQSIRNADPEGIWVTQGWLFYNERDYWTNARSAAYLGGIPAGKAIVLDLASTEHEVWRDQPAVRDGGWIFNTLHNYGQNTQLTGDLQHFLDVAHRTIIDPDHGKMLGMGLTPEGIDQNPVVYELMTDLMWHPEITSAKDWLPSYAESRYGHSSPKTEEAWNLLQESVYGNSGTHATWRYRPSLSVEFPNFDVQKVWNAGQDLLSSPELRRDNLYRRDLVDVTKTWLGAQADVYLGVALASFDEDKPRYKEYKGKYLTALSDLDHLMATRPEHRLTSWVNAAKGWGKDDAAKRLLEQNALMQVTVWGGPELSDYANKEWAGLNQSFIRERWILLFNALEKAGKTSAVQVPDYQKWDEDWAMSSRKIEESPAQDSWEVAKGIYDRYAKLSLSPEKLLDLDADPGIAVGKPIKDSGGTEGDHRPELAVDGSVLGNYWSASPAPQWLQIDLQSVHRVNEITLFPYFGDGRYYGYKIEVSTDGTAWTTVVDGSANTVVSTLKGYRSQFEPTPARFVKVTMLKNSANTGVHLYEVRVKEAK